MIIRRRILASLTLFMGLSAIFMTIRIANHNMVDRFYVDMSCLKYSQKFHIYLTIPNCEGSRDLGAGPVPFSTNQAGYWGHDYTHYPRKGVTRIALLGGSQQIAPGLPRTADPAFFIERKLANLGVDRVEVVNFSLEGFTTIHQALILDRVFRFHPDILVLDTITGYKPFRDYWLSKLAKFEGVKPVSIEPFAESVPKWLYSWALNIKAIRGFLSQLETLYLESSSTREIKNSPQIAEAYFRPTLNLLKFIKDRARQEGAQVFVVWDGGDFDNKSAVRKNDVKLAVTVSSALVEPIRIPAAEAKSILLNEGFEILNIEKDIPRSDERSFFLGDSYYYSIGGAKQYALGVANALAPLLKANSVRGHVPQNSDAGNVQNVR